jgi:hypothetical protein
MWQIKHEAKFSNPQKIRKKKKKLATWFIYHVANWRRGNNPHGKLAMWYISRRGKLPMW